MKSNRFLANDSGQVAGPVMAVMTLILLGAILFVGLSVMDGIESGTSLESGDTFFNASESVTGGVESAFGMTGVLMIIVISVAIIAALMGILVFIR